MRIEQISFPFTSEAVRAQTQTVSRRIYCAYYLVGTYMQPVFRACFDPLQKGKPIEKLSHPIKLTSVTREPLGALLDEPYGTEEMAREGCPELTPAQFIARMQATPSGRRVRLSPRTVVTRLAFEYVNHAVQTVEPRPDPIYVFAGGIKQARNWADVTGRDRAAIFHLSKFWYLERRRPDPVHLVGGYAQRPDWPQFAAYFAQEGIQTIEEAPGDYRVPKDRPKRPRRFPSLFDPIHPIHWLPTLRRRRNFLVRHYPHLVDEFDRKLAERKAAEAANGAQ